MQMRTHQGVFQVQQKKGMETRTPYVMKGKAMYNQHQQLPPGMAQVQIGHQVTKGTALRKYQVDAVPPNVSVRASSSQRRVVDLVRAQHQ